MATHLICLGLSTAAHGLAQWMEFTQLFFPFFCYNFHPYVATNIYMVLINSPIVKETHLDVKEVTVFAGNAACIIFPEILLNRDCTFIQYVSQGEANKTFCLVSMSK